MDKPVTFRKGKWGEVTLPVPQNGTRTGDLLELEFACLSLAEREGLKAFFSFVAMGMKEQWTYTDPVGREHLVRFDQPVLVFVQVTADVFDVTVGLTMAN